MNQLNNMNYFLDNIVRVGQVQHHIYETVLDNDRAAHVKRTLQHHTKCSDAL